MTDQATPAKVRLTDGLGPLPEAAFPAVREGDLQTACWEVDTYTADQMCAYAAAAVAADRERIINALPGGHSVDPQWVADMVRGLRA